MKLAALIAVVMLGLAPATAQAGCKDHAGSGVDWTGCSKKLLMLGSVSMDGAKLEGSNLTSTDLGGANLDGANLDNADLTGANLTNADLTWAGVRNANLSGLDLSNLLAYVGANWSDAFYDYRNEPTWDSGMDAAWRSSAGILRTTPEPAAILLALLGLALLPRRRRR